MWFLRLLPVFVTLLFILTQGVDVRIFRRPRLTIKISFTIIGILLYETERQRIRFKKMRKRVNLAKCSLRAMRYLISRSYVTVYNSDDTDTEQIFPSIPIFMFSALVLPYLSQNARKLKYRTENRQANTSFDISLRFACIHLIISALIFLYYLLRIKIRSTVKNV